MPKRKSYEIAGGRQGRGCGLTLLLFPGHLDYVQGELRGGGRIHVLLQVLSEELEHQVEFLLSMDHIQQSGREGSDSGHGSQGPNPPLPFPAHLTMLGCFNSLSKEISLIAVLGIPSVSLLEKMEDQWVASG